MRSSYKFSYYLTPRLFKLEKKEIGLSREVENISKLLKQKTKLNPSKTQKNILVYKKAATISPFFYEKSFLIHDGIFLQQNTIKNHMFFSKFGQYVFTKRMGYFIHKFNKIAKKKAKLKLQLLRAAKAKTKKSQKKQNKK